ncbi:MAG: hypothetical protein HYX22_02920 [Candidatus Yanofskybacteria bacterium]|nr:hypothetical protein [Candidatus Yanofskybacteria bacterium]
MKKNQLPLVIMSLEEWHQIEDIMEELSSPTLIKDVKKARSDYKKGRAIEYKSSN